MHCVRISFDGYVYVCDRVNNRLQVFTKAGKYVKEFFVRRETLGNGAVWDIAFSSDRDQRYLLVIDGENNVVWTLERDSGAIATSSSTTAATPGSSTGSTRRRSIRTATSIRARSTPRSGCRNSRCARVAERRRCRQRRLRQPVERVSDRLAAGGRVAENLEQEQCEPREEQRFASLARRGDRLGQFGMEAVALGRSEGRARCDRCGRCEQPRSVRSRTVEQRLGRLAADDEREIPGEVVGIVEAGRLSYIGLNRCA